MQIAARRLGFLSTVENVSRLDVRGGAKLSAASFGPDPGGTVRVSASEAVNVNGAGSAITASSPNSKPAARFTIGGVGVVPPPSAASAVAGRAHGVVAVFLDTADRQAPDYGIAGTFGALSDEQGAAGVRRP